MATKNYALVSTGDIHLLMAKWLLMANGDVGQGLAARDMQDRTVQIVGTFGAGGSVSIKGSNDGGTTWAVLTDPLGNALTFTSAGMKQITELPALIRPEVTAGDGTTSLNVYLALRGKNV